MMTIQLKDVVNSTDILKQLSEMRLKSRVAFDVGKLLKRLEEELNFFTDARARLIQEYATKNENGELAINQETNEYEFTAENMNKFVEEMNLLLDKEIEINANRINISDLGDLDFTPTQMMALEAFIEE